MNANDLTEFTTLLDSVSAMLSRGQYMPNEISTGIFFRVLAPYQIQAVRAAFDGHVRRSRFSPTPADLLDLLTANDGRPGAEEAWTAAVRGCDEADTVVWTIETGRAFAIARTVLDSGDKIGARMAFKEAYTRLVDEARQRGDRVEWQIMLGHDPVRRVEALRTAMAEGKVLAGSIELEALPPPRGDRLPALEGPKAGDSELAKAGKAALLALASRVRLDASADTLSPDAMAKLSTTADRDEADARVKAYAGQHGISLPAPTPKPQLRTGPAA